MRLFWISGLESGRLAIAPRPLGGEDLSREVQELRREGVTSVVSALTVEEEREMGLLDEERSCSEAGLRFRRLRLGDRSCPSGPAEIRELAAVLSEDLKQGASIVMHCRAGIGRASLLAGAALVALGWRPEVAWERLGEARGFAVPDTDEQREWLLRFRP